MLTDPQLLRALTLTTGLGAVVAVIVNVIGILIAVTLTRHRLPSVSDAVSQLSFLPMLLPGIASGAA
ncbi:iron(III) transport system permease protein [Loktanella fryxellensis]|uniref:Iron(III) transport system permease protein n=1 Tax=Loktanella fryxellensis TaxID=245187 RepID=A0A1H8B4U2_9RHOB|nr:hypothetical protein [Loktanella fryxellensis]SEM77329.1 iron(III) transport system permease protein [Loktanella fryxellensis]